MPETDPRALSTQRKRRGVVKASITRLGSCLKELESKVEEPTTHDHAQRLATKLETLDAEFKTHHFSLIDLIDDDETLEKEQETLDQHDDDVTTLAVASCVFFFWTHFRLSLWMATYLRMRNATPSVYLEL